MKICLGYPSLDDPRGFHQTGQNRQAQVFTAPAFIYPVIPAMAATLLRRAGHEIFWSDGPAEGLAWDQQLQRIEAFQPDLLAWEVKTPSVKLTWPRLNDVKQRLPRCHTVLMGDHVTALPQESLEACRVDTCLTGGDYDFGLVEIVKRLEGGEPARGVFAQPTTNDLKTLPVVDRTLTKWRLYGYERGSGNYKYLPGTHGMVGRDCFVAGTLIETNEGQVPVEHIHANHFVKTHEGRYHRVFEARSREVEETYLVKPYCNVTVQCTPEHPFWTRRGWVLAKDLTMDDYIGYPICRNIVDVEQLYGLPMEEADLWFYGMYVAEGYAAKHGRQDITLTLGKMEHGLLDRLVGYARGRGYAWRIRPTRTAVQIFFNHPGLLHGLKILFGLGASSKGIHPAVLQLPEVKLRAFVDGWFSGDGFRDGRNKSLRAVTVSKRLSLDVRNLLLRLSVISSIARDGLYEGLIEGRKIVGRWTPHRINVTKQFAGAWALIAPTLCGDTPTGPIPSGLWYNNRTVAFLEGGYAWYLVRTCAPAGPAVVYNFSVEGNQSYIADGLAVHNCWWRHDGGCTFCSWTNTFKNWRVGMVDQFMTEVESCASLGIRELFDDTGTFPIGAWLHDCCERLIKFNEGRQHGRCRVTIGCNMRPGALKKAEWDLMGRAGFRFILFGLESANYETLVKINKGQKQDDMRNAARMAKAAGLEPHVTAMVGYPWETKEDALNTIRLAQELFARGWIDTLQATICMPYPGTALFRQCQAQGWLKTTDWTEYAMDKPVMTCPMTEEEVLAITRGIYKSFVTPRYVLRKLIAVRTKDDLTFLLRGARLLLGHLTDFSGRRPRVAVH